LFTAAVVFLLIWPTASDHGIVIILPNGQSLARTTIFKNCVIVIVAVVIRAFFRSFFTPAWRGHKRQDRFRIEASRFRADLPERCHMGDATSHWTLRIV
jgi:hypothetical protein